jgi:hypothetical protein
MLWSELVAPIIDLFLHLILSVAVPLLDLSFELFTVAINLGKSSSNA